MKTEKCSNCKNLLLTEEEKDKKICTICLAEKKEKLNLWKEQLNIWRL